MFNHEGRLGKKRCARFVDEWRGAEVGGPGIRSNVTGNVAAIGVVPADAVVLGGGAFVFGNDVAAVAAGTLRRAG